MKLTGKVYPKEQSFIFLHKKQINMKKLLLMTVIACTAFTVKAQIPKLTSTEFTALKSSITKINLDCYSLVKPEYRYIFDYIKNKPGGNCEIYTAMATLTMVVHETISDGITTYTATPILPNTISCSKIDLTQMKMRSSTGLDIMFGGFLNPSTGVLATSLYLKTNVLTTNMTMREISAAIPNGGKVFTGSVKSGNYQVSAVLTIRNQCLNIGG